jgi:flavin reductase
MAYCSSSLDDTLEIFSEPAIDESQFREAMSRVATSVHIVTTDGPAGLGGITATSVASVTLEPPMMLFCINTLIASQETLANVFAGRTGHRLEERFTWGDWTKLATGAPVLKRAGAVFDCRLAEVKEVMTHFVMIGAVKAVNYGQQGCNFIYASRSYGRI